MNRSPSPPLRRLHVVVAGGGIAGTELALALRALTGTALTVTLVTPDAQLHYRPLSVMEPFTSRSTRHYPLDEISADIGVRLCLEELAAVDADERAIVTGSGERIAYDALVIATGARAHAGLAHAHTFFADHDPQSLHWIVRELEEGAIRRVAFVVPPGHVWPLPIYELALMTSARAHDMGIDDAELTVVTPEDAPLSLFHGPGSDAVADQLARAGVAMIANSYAHDYEGGKLLLAPGGRTLEVERAVALPVLTGPAIDGLPNDAEGFVHVDEHGHVPGLADVYAIGDATTFAIKQGGLAAQQADVVAATIARSAGAVVPAPGTRPLLRAVLFTGDGPIYLRATITGGESVASSASRHCPWWPPHKVAARHLAPYLADRDEVGRAVARRHALDAPLGGDIAVVEAGGPTAADGGIELLGRDRQ